jgi:flagellar basal-body rod protein FlgB
VPFTANDGFRWCVVTLFDIAAKHREWATLRQAVAAERLANSNTPGFRGRDVIPFDAFLTTSTRLENPDAAMIDLSREPSVEKDILDAGDASSQFALSTSITRGFHRFILASAKGPT